MSIENTLPTNADEAASMGVPTEPVKSQEAPVAEPTNNGNGNGNYTLSFSGLIKAIKDVGFPIAITLYLLFALNPKIDKVIEQQNQIINVLLQQSVRK